MNLRAIPHAVAFLNKIVLAGFLCSFLSLAGCQSLSSDDSNSPSTADIESFIEQNPQYADQSPGSAEKPVGNFEL